MSIFHTVAVRCPECDAAQDIARAASVNADRRADLRETILDGTFERHVCTACGATMQVPPHMTYIDMARGTWVLVESTSVIDAWKTHEAEALELFDTAFGPGAPEPSRAMALGVSPRLVFGWPALREKIVVAELELDDVTLELTKMAAIRQLPDFPIGWSALRLQHGDARSLVFAVTDDETEAVSGRIEVPRSAYDGIAADQESWKPLRSALAGKALVDVHRFTLEG